MQMRPLGSTGVVVSRFALGTMMFGRWGARDPEECTAMVDLALESGINAIDTADRYSLGDSESILGRALRGRRDDVVLATKCFWPMGEDPNRRGLSKRWILRAVEDSMRRLCTDRIDILYLHKPDAETAFDESLEAVDLLVRDGKVLALGTSSFPAHEIVQLSWEATRRATVRPRVEQPGYSVLARAVEADVFPTCLRHGIGVQVFSPLASGWLTGKYRADDPYPAGSRAATTAGANFDRERPEVRRKAEVVTGLQSLADEVGVSLGGMALAFAAEHCAVSSVLLGPRSLDQLRQLLTWAETTLDDETLDRIDELVPPGVDVDPADRWYQSPGLDRHRRRRVARVGG